MNGNVCRNTPAPLMQTLVPRMSCEKDATCFGGAYNCTSSVRIDVDMFIALYHKYVDMSKKIFLVIVHRCRCL